MNLPFRFITKTLAGARQKHVREDLIVVLLSLRLEGGVTIFRPFFSGQTHVSFCMLCFVGVKLVV